MAARAYVSESGMVREDGFSPKNPDVMFVVTNSGAYKFNTQTKSSLGCGMQLVNLDIFLDSWFNVHLLF
jgi:hypothetical protein